MRLWRCAARYAASQACCPSIILDADSKSVVNLGIALIATMSALVLGLLIASAKSSFDAREANSSRCPRMSSCSIASFPATDRRPKKPATCSVALLSHWIGIGPRIRPDLRSWTPLRRGQQAQASTKDPGTPSNDFRARSRAYTAKVRQAMQTALDLRKARSLLLEQAGSSIPTPFLVMLVFWLAVIFISFGLFAPYNTTVVATLFVCALSVSGAIFLILELDSPLAGLAANLRHSPPDAIAHLGQ